MKRSATINKTPGISRKIKSDRKTPIKGATGELFMRYFKEYLMTMFEQYPRSIKPDVPREFALNHLVGSLAEAVRWWIRTRMQTPPEELAEDYLKLIGYQSGT